MTAASKAVSQDVSKPAVRIRDITTSLQRQMARPGGIDLDVAVAAAEQGLEGRREETLRVIQDKVQTLAAFCAGRPAAPEAQVYAIASVLVDTAGFLDMPAFYEAAYSLCEVVSRMSAAEAWSWPSIDVHVHALLLILGEGGAASDANSTLLAGLRAVVDRTPAPG
ncbi:MAG: hypothetical protein ACT6R7_15555 [Brevundimonas aurantiaca]|uniref:hypothetical protein n=1 Tax=Brevundimonas aurantiaca TaxID=74316 RepID=UPI004033525E